MATFEGLAGMQTLTTAGSYAEPRWRPRNP